MRPWLVTAVFVMPACFDAVSEVPCPTSDCVMPAGGGRGGEGGTAGGSSSSGGGSAVEARDAGPPDAGRPDAGDNDAGPFDAGRVDAGGNDAGRFDAGGLDAGGLDAGSPPVARRDAGSCPVFTRDGGASGALGQWSPTTPMLAPRWRATSVTDCGFVYELGGIGPQFAMADVNVARIMPGGALGLWGFTTPLPSARSAHAVTTWDGVIYVSGGGGGPNGSMYTDVLMAPVTATGALGAWTTAGALPSPRSGHQSVVHDGRLYIIGGTTPGTLYRNDVLVADIRPDGTLSPFRATTSFANPRFEHAAVAAGDALVLSGGAVSSGNLPSDVQIARFLEDGGLSAWAATTPMPRGLVYHSMVAHDGWLFVLGGLFDNMGMGDESDAVYIARVADGGVGPWASGPSFFGKRQTQAAVEAGGFLYLLGGLQGANRLADVQVAPIQ